jgi:hypothetical protein
MKTMKQLTAAVLVTIFITSAAIMGQSDSSQKAVHELQQKVAAAYKTNNLTSLDGKHLFAASVRVVIEHSIAEGKNGDALIESRQFTNVAAIDKWLKKRREDDDTPFNETMPLLRCRQGRCAYNFDGGILHNHLYLHDLYYTVRNGKPYVTRIHLLDGD